MRILVLGTNYAPEKTAVAPFATGLCEYLASEGHEITVVTTFPYYPQWRVYAGYRGRVFQRERIKGVELRRVWHFVPSRASSLVQRLAHDFSFTVTAFAAGLFAGGFDVLYCTCPPPMLALTAYILATLHRKPFVIKLTDLASDAALATGILRNGVLIRLARALEAFVYRKADRVVCLCRPFIEKLKDRGIQQDKLILIPDWGDTRRIYPIVGATGFRRAHRISPDAFVIMHTGNMGKKQDLMNVVRAAELLRDSRDLVWILVGHGEERASLEDAIRSRHLENIRLLPLQPEDSMAEMYSGADVLLLNQKATLEDSVIPSKLLTYMAAGRAVLAAVSHRSEAAREIVRAQCGLRIPAADPRELATAVIQLRADSDLRQRLGGNGRNYAELHFTKGRVLRDYDVLFSGYTQKQGKKQEVSEKAAVAR